MKAIACLSFACAVSVVVGCPMLSRLSPSGSLSSSYDECVMFHPEDTCKRAKSQGVLGWGDASSRKLLSATSTAPPQAPCQGAEDIALIQTMPFNPKYKEVMAKMKDGVSGACAKCALKYNGYDSRIVAHTCIGLPQNPPVLSPLEIPCNTTESNCFRSGSLLQPVVNALTFIDLISIWAAGLMPSYPVPDNLKDKDMCVWSYQSLPPPAGNKEPYYRVPANDSRWYYQLCAIATERFQKWITDKPGGPVVFGGCSLGKQSLVDACNISGVRANLPNLTKTSTPQMIGSCSTCDIKLSRTQYSSPEEFAEFACRADVQNTEIEWPQAVTMFRVKAASNQNGGLEKATSELKTMLNKWRDETHGEHKPNMDWVFKANGGAPLGKDGAAMTKGWGAGGPGIRRKVIPCDAIDRKYTEPGTTWARWAPPFNMDQMGPNGIGIQAEAYLHWKQFCSAYPAAGVGAECTFKYLNGKTGAPVTTGAPKTTGAPTAGPLPQIPGKCDWSAYQSNQIRCAQPSKGWFGGFTNKSDAAVAKRNESAYQCALAMCNTLSTVAGAIKVPHGAETFGGVEVSWSLAGGKATITADRKSVV